MSINQRHDVSEIRYVNAHQIETKAKVFGWIDSKKIWVTENGAIEDKHVLSVKRVPGHRNQMTSKLNVYLLWTSYYLESLMNVFKDRYIKDVESKPMLLVRKITKYQEVYFNLARKEIERELTKHQEVYSSLLSGIGIVGSLENYLGLEKSLENLCFELDQKIVDLIKIINEEIKNAFIKKMVVSQTQVDLSYIINATFPKNTFSRFLNILKQSSFLTPYQIDDQNGEVIHLLKNKNNRASKKELSNQIALVNYASIFKIN